MAYQHYVRKPPLYAGAITDITMGHCEPYSGMWFKVIDSRTSITTVSLDLGAQREALHNLQVLNESPGHATYLTSLLDAM